MAALVSSPPAKTSDYVNGIIADVRAKNPAEPEFHQAVQEVVESLDSGARAATRVPRRPRSSSGSSSPSG